jgi:hypothetical protein
MTSFHRSRLFAVCIAASSMTLATSGCRVNEDDIHRWESTAHGPDKLRAVLQHDKYEPGLRVEAAISLIRMKPRAGRRIGIQILVDTLAAIPPDTRQVIVSSLVPSIIAELKKPPPVGQAGQPSPPDPSYPYKDAAFAMLTIERTVIVADEALKQNLKQALIDWAMADFEHRLDNRTQAFGMEQLLRMIGPPGVARLPKLMTRDAKRLEQMASLVAELGDAKTKEAASQALVVIAQYVTSDAWVKTKKPELEAANKASKLEPTPAQFQAQLSQYQEEELFRVFGSMKKVGGRPAVNFLLGFAAAKEPDKRRQAALAALEGRLDRKNPDDLKRILQIASSDAPDVVLDQAFKRIGEMPRDLVVERLYEQFRSDKWKVRRAAAATVLRMSTVKHIDEFMSKLPDGQLTKTWAMPEALSYGAFLGELKEGKPLDALKRYFNHGNVAQRTSAISYWYSFGNKKNVKDLEPYENDRTRLPNCETDPECKWACDVPKEGSKEVETKELKTVGEFVSLCLIPSIKTKEPETKKP